MIQSVRAIGYFKFHLLHRVATETSARDRIVHNEFSMCDANVGFC